MYIGGVENGSETLFIAIFYIKSYQSEVSTLPNELLWCALQLAELLLMLLAGALNLYTVYMALTSSPFHANINLIYSVFMLHWFELLVSRLFVFPFQEGLLPLGPADVFSASLLQYTFDDAVVRIRDPDRLFSLFLGAGIRLRYMLLVCFALPTFAIERCVATWHVRNYERRKRMHVSAIPIVAAEIIATFAAFLATFQCVTPFFLATTAVLMQIVSYILILMIKETTKYFERKCERNADFYSLSVKFQLAENVRSLKVIHVIVFEVAVMIILTAVTIVLAYLDLLSKDHTVLVFVVVEKLMHINPLFISAAVFIVQPKWLTRLVALFPRRLQRRAYAFTKYADPATTAAHRSSSSPRLSLADVHFEQLRKVWSPA